MPDVMIEGVDTELCGKRVWDMNGNPAAMLYGLRAGMESIPYHGKVYYGKVGCLGEFFHESELKFL